VTSSRNYFSDSQVNTAGCSVHHNPYSSCSYFLQGLVTELLELKFTLFFHAAEPLCHSVAKLSKKGNPTFYRKRGANAKNHKQNLRSILSLARTALFTSSLKPILILSSTIWLHLPCGHFPLGFPTIVAIHMQRKDTIFLRYETFYKWILKR